MCLAVPGRVVELGSGEVRTATVEVAGVPRQVNLELLDPQPRPGDHVVVHLGYALNVVSAEEARELERILEEITQPVLEEEPI